MSTGLGEVQRKIAEILARDVDQAYSVYELCMEVYGAAVEEASRGPLRAAKSLAKKNRSFGWTGSSGFGYVFFNIASVMSYGRARLKSNGSLKDEIRTRLAPGGYAHQYIAFEGGEWWLLTQKWVAEQNNDTARLQELKPMLDAMEEGSEGRRWRQCGRCCAADLVTAI